MIQPLPYDDEHLVPPEAPYPGLRPFRSNESGIFCGRARQIDEVIAGLDNQHFSAVLGGSGCGKSSLIRAGVIPKLLAYGIEDRGDSWLPAVFTPGDQPIERMAQALERLLSPPADDAIRQSRLLAIAEDLRGPRGLATFDEFFRADHVPEEDKALRLRTNVLVVVDQFEEIFRKENRNNPDAEHLVRCISYVQRNPDKYPRIFVILTMRTEDLHNCATFLRLPDVLNKTFFLTGRLNETELSQAILYPARLFVPEGAQLESYSGPPRYDPRPFHGDVLARLNEAASEISDDPDHLPLLQHFLFHIWRSALVRWARDTQQPFAIELDHLKSAAGANHANELSILRRCVANNADHLYEQLTPEQRIIAETLFRLLAEVDDKGVYKRQWTNRRKVAEVRGAPYEDIKEDMEAVIRAFASPDPYIRIDGERPGKATNGGSGKDATGGNPQTNKIDVSHESFIRNWPRFGKWLRNELEKSKIYEELICALKNDKQQGERIDNKALLQIETVLRVGDCSYAWAQRYNDLIRKHFGNHITEDRCKEIYQESCDFYKQSLKLQQEEIEEEKKKIENMARLKEKAEQKEREIKEQAERHKLAMEAERLQNEIALQEKEHQAQIELREQQVRQEIKLKEERKRRKYILGLGAVIIVLAAIIVWRVWKDNQWSMREATAFQPYAVASAIKGPVSPLPEKLQRERLWEAAVALRAVDTLQADTFVADNRDLSVRHLRLERASRLAHELSNHAVREIMRSVPWKLSKPTAGGTTDPGRGSASTGAEAGRKRESMEFRPLAMGDSLHACWLRINDLALEMQNGHAGNEGGNGNTGKRRVGQTEESLQVAGGADAGSVPSKGILYNKARGLLTFATVSSDTNACKPALTMQIPPGAEVFADSSLEMLSHVSVVGSPRSRDASAAGPNYRSFLYRLRWYSNCRRAKGQAASGGCTLEWKVDPDSLGYLEFAVAPTFDTLPGTHTFAVRSMRDGSEIDRYRVHWHDTMEPIAGQAGTSEEPNSPSKDFDCNVLPGKNFAFCGLQDKEPDKRTIFKVGNDGGIINAFASDGAYLALLVDLEGAQLGHHVILVFRFEGDFANSDQAFVAMKHPIATIEYVGPSAKRMWFGKDENGQHDGHLYILGEDGARYRGSWSPRALREVACRILKQTGPTEAPELETATSTYQLLEAHEDGVIKRFKEDPCGDFAFWNK